MHRRMVEIGAAAFMASIVALGMRGPLLAQEEDAKPEGFVNQEGEVIDGVVVDGVLVDRYTGEAVEGVPAYAEEVVEGVPVPRPSVTPPEGDAPRLGGPGGFKAGPSVAPPGNSVPRPGGPGFTGGPGDPTRFRQIMLQQMKQRLGIDDEAWKVIAPRLAKVMDLNRQLSAGLGMFGTFGGRPGGPVVLPGAQPGTAGAPANATARVRTARANPAVREGGPQGEPTALGKAIAQLRTTLANPSASPEDIKKRLTAVQAARERLKQELAAAQGDLRKLLTVRQEAQLILMGQLS